MKKIILAELRKSWRGKRVLVAFAHGFRFIFRIQRFGAQALLFLGCVCKLSAKGEGI